MMEQNSSETTTNVKPELTDAPQTNKSSREELLSRFKCSTTTQKRIMQREKKERNPHKKKRIRLEIHKKVDEAVSRWFHLMRERKIFLNGPIIREQALKFADMMNIPTFQASNGWLWRWQKRENVDFRALNKERNLTKVKTVTPVQISEAELSVFLEEKQDAANNYTNSEPQQCVTDETDTDTSQMEEKRQYMCEVKMENEDDGIVKRSEADEALTTLLRYISANGMKFKTLDDIVQHFGNDAGLWVNGK